MRAIFGGRRNIRFAHKKVLTGPTLLNPTGSPYSALTAPVVSSLPDITISSNTQLSGYSRSNPLKAKTLTINSNVIITSINFSLWIWVDKLVLLSGAQLNVKGQDGTEGAAGDGSVGAAGGDGGSGGGGGATVGSGMPCPQLLYGGNGGSGGNGTPGSAILGNGGLGGLGYGLSYVGASAGTFFPVGGNGGRIQATGCVGSCEPPFIGAGAPGYGGGGGGGSVTDAGCLNCCDVEGAGAGAGGGLICGVAREISGTLAQIDSRGGNGGIGFGVGATGSGGGGGGSVSLYAQKYNGGISSFKVTGGSNGQTCEFAGSGGYWLTEINNAGTGLGTKHINTNPSWDNS